jgi:hypothetical protein
MGDVSSALPPIGKDKTRMRPMPSGSGSAARYQIIGLLQLGYP